jgi:hypothetical protein
MRVATVPALRNGDREKLARIACYPRAIATVADAPASSARLIIDEQAPLPGADFESTVDAAHLILAGGLADVVIASATSDAHNCNQPVQPDTPPVPSWQ